MRDKASDAIRGIYEYCEKIREAMRRFTPSRERFNEEAFYRDGLAFYVQQIGELVKELPDEYIDDHPEIPWHQIRGFRNIIAHAYGSVDMDILWETTTEDIPRLREFCMRELGEGE